MPVELVVDKPNEQPAQEKPTNEEAAVSSEDTNGKGDKTDAPAARAVVGIIYPPPEVRSIQLSVSNGLKHWETSSYLREFYQCVDSESMEEFQ